MRISGIEVYDGKLLHQRFAFKYFGHNCNPAGNIIVFRGKMEVLAEGMIDQEDALAEDFIYSEDAVNILWELPVLGNSVFGAVAFQRLFNFELANILAAPEFLGQPVQMDGDDIYFRDRHGNPGKASVSITHVRDHAALGHTGINIHAGTKAPQHAFSTELTDEQTEKFIKKVIEKFYSMNHDIFIATTKILTGGF